MVKYLSSILPPVEVDLGAALNVKVMRLISSLTGAVSQLCRVKSAASFSAGALAARFASSTSGNTAMVFAFSLVPILGLTGYAIDYSRAMAAKTTLDANADSAVLAALAPRNINTQSTAAQQDAASKAKALALFNSAALPPGIALTAVQADVVRTSTNVTVNLSYSASLGTTLAKIIGTDSIVVSGATAASSVGSRYIDVYVLADSSTSMGVGASPADQSIMSSAIGCTLACHASGTDAKAHAAGATLRFDVVKSALANIVAQAQNASSTNVIRFGVYSFADAMQTEIDITSNLSGVATAVNNMQLASFDGGTNAAYALTSLKARIATGFGDGSSPAMPLVFVLFLTDAIGNSVDNPASGSWIVSPNYVAASPHAIPDPSGNGQMDLTGIDPAWCQPLKNAGANVMTLELKYVLPAAQVSSDLRSQYIASALQGSTSANMLACASGPSMALSANLPSDIQAAAQRLFATALQAAPRLVK